MNVIFFYISMILGFIGKLLTFIITITVDNSNHIGKTSS